jgi:predicted outer membrane repeat protein
MPKHPYNAITQRHRKGKGVVYPQREELEQMQRMLGNIEIGGKKAFYDRAAIRLPGSTSTAPFSVSYDSDAEEFTVTYDIQLHRLKHTDSIYSSSKRYPGYFARENLVSSTSGQHHEFKFTLPPTTNSVFVMLFDSLCEAPIWWYQQSGDSASADARTTARENTAFNNGGSIQAKAIVLTTTGTHSIVAEHTEVWGDPLTNSIFIDDDLGCLGDAPIYDQETNTVAFDIYEGHNAATPSAHSGVISTGGSTSYWLDWGAETAVTTSPSVVTSAPASARVETYLFDITLASNGAITQFINRNNSPVAVPSDALSGNITIGADGADIGLIYGSIVYKQNN